MKLKEESYYGFNHKAVREKFGGDLEFVCELPVALMSSSGLVNVPCAVYKAHKPDREKGHKDYALFFSHAGTYMLTGRNEQEIGWVLPGIHCKCCDEVLVSIDRHHFNQCSCQNETFIDGGADYQRIGAMDLTKTESVSVNMRTKEIKVLTPS